MNQTTGKNDSITHLCYVMHRRQVINSLDDSFTCNDFISRDRRSMNHGECSSVENINPQSDICFSRSSANFADLTRINHEHTSIFMSVEIAHAMRTEKSEISIALFPSQQTRHKKQAYSPRVLEFARCVV